MKFFGKMIFWLQVLKFEISYNRVYNIWKEGFWFLLEDFWKIIFSDGEIFEFP